MALKLKYLVPILIIVLVAGVLVTMVFYAVILRTPRDTFIEDNTVSLAAATCSCPEAKHFLVFYIGFGNDVSIQVTVLSGDGPVVVYVLEDYPLVNGTNVNTTMTWQFHSYVPNPNPNVHYEVWANKYELEIDNLGSQIANVTAQITEHYRYCFLSVCNR